MPPERILILGGTRDARQIAEALLEAGCGVITSLAGVTEQPMLPAGDVRIGGFGGVEGLSSYLRSHNIALVVDATHPFAARMSAQAAEACRSCGVPLLRFERPTWLAGKDDNWINVATAAEAASVLPARARVLLTTGRKDLEPFFARDDISGIARMIEAPPLALPSNWQLLRERPPFTLTSEAALMAQHGITHVVTKNSGGNATEAKLEAAREARIPVVMIARPYKPQVPCHREISALVAAAKRLVCP